MAVVATSCSAKLSRWAIIHLWGWEPYSAKKWRLKVEMLMWHSVAIDAMLLLVRMLRPTTEDTLSAQLLLIDLIGVS